MPSARVLILSLQPLAAALLGMLVELEQLEPAFAAPGEQPVDALARVRPLLVVLLDGAMEEARSDVFLARATRRGVRVVLFAPPGGGIEVGRIAEERALPWFCLPVDRATLARLIGDRTSRTRSGTERRQPPAVSRAADGSLIFEDEVGRRWHVYDRRGGDRRMSADAEPKHAPPDDYRVFVSDRGEKRRIRLEAGARLAVTASALAEQLARATPVRAPNR